MNSRLVMLIAACCLTGGLYAQNSMWVKPDDGALPRSGAAIVEFNNRVWSLGGRAPNVGNENGPVPTHPYNSAVIPWASPLTSPDGELTNSIWSAQPGGDWQLESATAPWSPREGQTALNFNGRMWLIGGGNDVWSSADGTTWRRECTNALWGNRRWHTSVVHNGRMWIIGGTANPGQVSDVWSSADGVNWRMDAPQAIWPARSRHASVVFNGLLWILGGDTGGTALNDVWSSPDGFNWTQHTQAATWGARKNLSAAVLNGRMYVLGGTLTFLSGDQATGDVWSSTDGANWSTETYQAEWSARSSAACMVINNELWIMGGADHYGIFFMDAWSSTTGATWTAQGPRIGLPHGLVNTDGGRRMVAFKGRMWLIAGADGQKTFNDVWSSDDGINWMEMPTPPFAPRHCHTVEVLNGRMYVIGGEESLFNMHSDVWSTADGINWTLESNDTWLPFPWVTTSGYGALSCHSSVVFNGRIWVMGGFNGFLGANRNIWSSADGANWRLESDTAPFLSLDQNGNPSQNGAIAAAGLEVVNGKLVFYGGVTVEYHDNNGVTITFLQTGRIWTSWDGVNWTEEPYAPWGPREGFGCASHNGRVWVLGGYAGTRLINPAITPGLQDDIWSSTDGATWINDVPFGSQGGFMPKRGKTHATVFNNELWVHGGWNGTVYSIPRMQDSWRLIENGVAPQLTCTPQGSVIAGDPYGFTATATGSPAPTFSVSGDLPAWMNINLVTGEFTGSPTLADIGTSGTITLTANNVFGSDSTSFTVTVLGPPPQFTTTPPTVATVGQLYSYAVGVAGGPPTPTVVTGNLPAWLSFDPQTLLLTGTPAVQDIGLTAPITLTASNGTQPDALQSFSIDVRGIAPQLNLTGGTVNAITGQAFSYTISATGNPVPVVSVSGLPAWLSFDPVTGELSGMPIPGVDDAVIDISADNGWGTANAQLTVTLIDSWSTRASTDSGCAAGGGTRTSLFGLLALMLGLGAARAARRRLRG